MMDELGAAAAVMTGRRPTRFARDASVTIGCVSGMQVFAETAAPAPDRYPAAALPGRPQFRTRLPSAVFHAGVDFTPTRLRATSVCPKENRSVPPTAVDRERTGGSGPTVQRLAPVAVTGRGAVLRVLVKGHMDPRAGPASLRPGGPEHATGVEPLIVRTSVLTHSPADAVGMTTRSIRPSRSADNRMIRPHHARQTRGLK